MLRRWRGSKRRSPMAEPVALAALALDAAFGWPRALYRRIGHPVGLFARIIDRCAARWNRPEYDFASRRALGVLTLILLLILVAGTSWAAQYLLFGAFGVWGWIGVVPLLTGLFGTCPLYSMLGMNTCPMKKTS